MVDIFYVTIEKILINITIRFIIILLIIIIFK